MLGSGKSIRQSALPMGLLLLLKLQKVPLDLLVDIPAFADLYTVVSPYSRSILVAWAHPWAT